MSASYAKSLFFVLIVLVAFLFFFPSSDGGFQSRSGPTTPVNSLRIVLAGLFLLLAAGRIAASCLRPSHLVLVELFSSLFRPPDAVTSGISLRC
jgi:hypothetical protein